MNNPPKSALHFLRWFCPESLYESIEGDLLEQFEDDVNEVGEKRARRRLFWNAIKFFRPGILFRHSSSFKFSNLLSLMDMFSNYLKIALRSIKRHKAISFINIAGLAVCMSVGLLILMHIKTLNSYDQFHPYPDRTHRITTRLGQGDYSYFACSPPVLQSELTQYPAIENTTFILNSGSPLALSGKLEIPVRTSFTENSFFSIFGFTLVSGDVTTVLTNPYTAVLSEDASKKIFGTTEPLGNTFEIKDWGLFTVAGILKTQNKRSHFNQEILISKSTLPSLFSNHKLPIALDRWEINTESNIYVLLKTKDQDLQQALDQISKKALVSDKAAKFSGDKTLHFSSLALNERPPSDLNIPSFGAGGIGTNRSLQEIAIISGFGLLFILLAVFNYTNLTVARAFSRAKEVGVRKVTGAVRIQIATQIITESIFIAFISLTFSFIIIQLIPSTLIKSNIDLNIFDISLLAQAFSFAILVGLAAGFIPAIILSRINPLQALGKLLNIRLFKTLGIKNTLIVIQFSVSLIFLTVMYILYSQSEFQINSDLGFDRKDILTVPLHDKDYLTLQSEIGEHTAIVSLSASSASPFGHGKFSSQVVLEAQQSIEIPYLAIDTHFIHTWALKLVSGNNIKEQSNEQFVILNESAVRKLELGSPSDAIGKSILVDSTQLQIVGVVKDFHSENFKWSIRPLMLRYRPMEFKEINIKFNPVKFQSLYTHIKKVWSKLEPDFPLASYLFEEAFENDENRTQDKVSGAIIFFIAIFVSCLGLFGVVLYSMEVRAKEIAIRKIMGSSVWKLTMTLSKSFFLLLVIALCIGLPSGYLIGQEILNGYAYKVNVGVDMVFTMIMIMAFIGFITICSQTIRAALASPVKALKND